MTSKWFLFFVIALDAAITLNVAFGDKITTFVANGLWPTVVEYRLCPE